MIFQLLENYGIMEKWAEIKHIIHDDFAMYVIHFANMNCNPDMKQKIQNLHSLQTGNCCKILTVCRQETAAKSTQFADRKLLQNLHSLKTRNCCKIYTVCRQETAAKSTQFADRKLLQNLHKLQTGNCCKIFRFQRHFWILLFLWRRKEILICSEVG